MDLIKLLHDRSIFYVDRPNLQELASYQAALSLWYGHISRSNCGDDPTGLQFSVNSAMYRNFNNHIDLNNIAEFLKMPQSLEKLLKKALTRVAKETTDWLGELHCVIDTSFYDLNWCVWFDDGKIDHKRSALKILSSNDELSNVEKFALMCKFCLEDEIMKFSLDLLPEDFTSQAIFLNNRLFQYWYFRVKIESRKAPGSVYQNFSLDADMALFAAINFRQWTVFEYFWNRLDVPCQSWVADRIISFDYFSTDFLQRLLRMLQSYQHCILLSANHKRILCKFAIEGDSLRVARWAWTHSKHLITSETFVEFVDHLIERRLDAEKWMDWLVEVWDSTSNEYKIKAAEELKDELFTAFVFRRSYSLSSFEILCRFLSLQSVDSRRKIMLENASQFGPHIVDHHSANEMLKSYLPKAVDQKKFKKLVLESFDMKYVCEDLIISANFDRLNMLLEFYLDTSNDVLPFKKELLKSKTFATKFVKYHVGNWNAVRRFIVEEMFPKNAPLGLQTKKQLVCSIFVSYFYYDWDDESPSAQEVTELIRIVDSEFEKHDVIDLKRTLWCSVQLMLKNCQDSLWYEVFFNEKCFLRFVRWCVGDGDRVVLDFENGFFVNTMFDGVFSALNKNYSPEGPNRQVPRINELMLIDLEEYLSWYFASYEEMAKYKLGRMNSFQVDKIFRAAVNRGDEKCLRVLLNWFFQCDESAILEFRSSGLLRFQMDEEMDG